MASGKKPSIYDDRSSIGSSKELDEYGVWVKSEPQDLDADEGDFSLPDLSVDAGSLPDFDLNLEDPPSFGEDFSIDDIDDEETPVVSGGEEDDLNIVDFDQTAGEFNLDLPDLPVEEAGTDLSDLSSLPDLSDLPDFSSGEETAASGSGAYEDLSLDTDLDTDITSSEGLSLSEGDFDLSPEAAAGEEAGIDAGAEPAEGSGGDTDFTEVPLEDILGDISLDIPTEADPEETPAPGKQESSVDLSTELLKKIAAELASIRSELSTLKNEFSVIRNQTPAREENTAGGNGFFDQGADTEIALTGDELDNIISTADFTEEAGSDAGGTESGDFPSLDDLSLPLEEPLDTEAATEDATPTEPGIDLEEASLPAPEDPGDTWLLSGEAETAAGEDAADTVDLGIDADLSIEDVSFEGLEMEGEETLDLSNAVIDEPNLGDEIQENPVEEPFPEDISLDLGEFDGESAATPDDAETEALVEEEIGLSLPEEAGEAELPADIPAETAVFDDSLDQVIPEGFVVESEKSPVPFDDDIEEQENFGSAEGGDPDVAEEEAVEEAAALEDPPLSLDMEDDFSIPAAETDDANFAETSREDTAGSGEISGNLKQEIKSVLSYMDKLLEALPEKKIEEFAKSEYFDTYKKLFKELGLV
jgi:hypothetical protein